MQRKNVISNGMCKTFPFIEMLPHIYTVNNLFLISLFANKKKQHETTRTEIHSFEDNIIHLYFIL